MEKIQTLNPNVVLELGDAGIETIKIFADTPSERDAGIALLQRLSPELRALESALTKRREITR